MKKFSRLLGIAAVAVAIGVGITAPAGHAQEMEHGRVRCGISTSPRGC